MFTITKLKMWKNPGYTRGCLEVPPRGSWKLPNPDYTSVEDLRPRRGSTLSAIELPLSYLEVFEMSYLYMEATDSKNNTTRLFGWILSIEEIASANEAVRITWEVDYWRTYSQDAIFGSGTITRCKDATYKRPYRTVPRYKLIDRSHSLTGAELYFLIARSIKDSDDNITAFSYEYERLGQDDGTYVTISLEDMFSGKLDEYMGIDPESILNAWILPRDPSDYFSNAVWQTKTVGSSTYGWWRSFKPRSNRRSYNLSSYFPNGLKSDDMQSVVTLDAYGNIASMLPWGMSLDPESLYITADISPENVCFYITDESVDSDGNEVFTEGRFLKIEGVNVPLNSNAFSSYYYSGMREYDKRNAEIQRNQQAVSGLTSSISGATGGAIAGAIAGATGGPVGAIGGAILGTIGPLIGTGVNYLSSGYFNDEYQDEKDKLYSNQVSTLLKSGVGLGWWAISGQNSYNIWKIAILKADPVSLAEYTSDTYINGYAVEINTNNTLTYINNGGPLQIRNLNITGSIPPQAKQSIKDKLLNGVRIVENNPAGVNP